jgi:hypothetical protein
MEEIQNELNEMRKEMREECMEQNQDVTDYRPDIAHNRQNIHNFNTRQSKLCCLLNLIKITCLFELFFFGGRVY